MKKASQAVGWTVVAAGAVLVLIGASPLFPAIHWEGIIIGLGSFGAGAWILAGPEVRAAVRRALRVRGEARSLERRVARRRDQNPTSFDPLLPVRILKLARERGGLLTVGEVAIELDVPIPQAEAALGECVRAGNALPDYDVARGCSLYRFPEFHAPDEPSH